MYHLADVVQMKKPHACGENKWEILRLGADIRIKCMGCGHIVMMSRGDFNKRLKKLVTMANDPKNEQLEYYVPKDKIIVPHFD
ncbi:DUF951 domain-containing protein [Lactobacillus rodentium]|uniref:DUF951 domain-containing protein n=1 Tax=Lactobacillus rodentium TaxID=947835 RepID=A0A2Z6TDQ9_9LACO|nr:DUF951 domain-containing protein [Lactobacillus rodentium]MCR1894043.1 DUF951 domain-containing protein [Lactobacillus rodentium]GBG04092.1 hypothetical protein LrDSM24759_00060 [Lactobacillus rodentium]